MPRMWKRMILKGAALGEYIVIHYDVISTIKKYATAVELKREAGGVLIGSYRGDTLM
jgi:hypothetical protein